VAIAQNRRALSFLEKLRKHITGGFRVKDISASILTKVLMTMDTDDNQQQPSSQLGVDRRDTTSNNTSSAIAVTDGSASINHQDETSDDGLHRHHLHSHSHDDDNKLVLWQGVALLTADCMGVGVLALPNDIHALGWAVGVGFLLANLPINYYAGNLLAMLALDIEDEKDGGMMGPNNVHDRRVIQKIPTQDQGKHDDLQSRGQRRSGKCHSSDNDLPIIIDDDEQVDTMMEIQMTETSLASRTKDTGRAVSKYSSCQDKKKSSGTAPTLNLKKSNNSASNTDGNSGDGIFRDAGICTHVNNEDGGTPTDKDNDDNITSDLINISRSVFTPQAVATYMVKAFYYTNLFLVLGDYILVMARSVSAIFSDEICLPTAGAIASVLMFGLCQYRSMANLGRSVSLASLLALLIVIVQCLFHHRTSSSSPSGEDEDQQRQIDDVEDDGIWGKFSSLAGIGFAVGSQKLFLNIRHELRHREESSKVLAGSLTSYGLAYVIVIILAGPDPPSFLFDSIPEGWSRRLAGLLLWFHVAVSYAINSQALCSSLDHMLTSSSRRWSFIIGNVNPVQRWFSLTLIVSISSYLVANAIPFFKDLVGLVSRSGFDKVSFLCFFCILNLTVFSFLLPLDWSIDICAIILDTTGTFA
jgi:Transmembrane amino acid transporter protein